MFSKFMDIIRLIKIHFIRMFFAATSLAPLILVIGVSFSEDKSSYIYFFCGLILCLLLIFICCAILKRFAKQMPKSNRVIKTIERKDNDILAYLFIFLLPFIRSDNSMLGNQPITTIFCVVIILAIIANIGAYYFNPVLRLLGYHVYFIEIEDAQGILLAKTDNVLYGKNIKLYLAELSANYRIYLHTKSMIYMQKRSMDV